MTAAESVQQRQVLLSFDGTIPVSWTTPCELEIVKLEYVNANAVLSSDPTLTWVGFSTAGLGAAVEEFFVPSYSFPVKIPVPAGREIFVAFSGLGSVLLSYNVL